MFLPIFIGYGTDMAWLAILVAMNLQMSFLTPPFGWALFFLKGVAPKEVSTGHIYLGAIPFVGMLMLSIALVFLFPSIATWLPAVIGW
jgi:TRAP-type mannitol/chloroaromatic compound transport system permease large subunit